MVSLELHHHVYTSREGYRTIFASKRLSAEVVAAVEEGSRRLYPRLHGGSSRSLYYYGSYLCHTRVFRYGSDHVGRPRTCVHNVLIDLATSPVELDPFALPEEAFLSADVPDDEIGYELLESTAWPTAQETLASRAKQLVSSDKSAYQFVTGLTLLQTSQPWILRAATSDAFSWIGQLAAFLPPMLRNRLTVVSGVSLPNTVVSILAPSADLDPKCDLPILDFKAGTGRGLPPCSEYAGLVGEYLYNRRELAVLSQVQALIAYYQGNAAGAHAALDRFSKVFRATRRFVDRSGDWRIDADSLETFLVAFVDLSLGGFSQISETVLDRCFEILYGSKDLGTIAVAVSALRNSLQHQTLDDAGRQSLRGLLLPRLSRLFFAPKKTVRIRDFRTFGNRDRITGDLKTLSALLAPSTGRVNSGDLPHGR